MTILLSTSRHALLVSVFAGLFAVSANSQQPAAPAGSAARGHDATMAGLLQSVTDEHIVDLAYYIARVR